MAPQRRIRKLKFRPKGRSQGYERLEPRLMLWSGVIPNGTVWDSSQVQQITGNVDIPAGSTLTIKPGTIVKFDGGTSLTVDGTLNAQGTSAAQIYFTSILDDSVGGDTDGDGGANQPGRGNWRQILFTSTSTNDVLDHVVVRYGGSDADSGEVEADGAAPTLSNSVVSDSLHFGVNLTGSNATLTGDTFQNDDQPENGSGLGGAIQMDVNSQPKISAASFSNNYVNAVWVDPGTLPSGTTAWNNPDVVYFVPRTITVPTGATLNVGAGQVVKLIQSITVNGTLTAEGTAADPVTFTSWHDNSVGGSTIQDGNSGPQRGDWNQIQFTNTSTADVLDHVVVRYGGSNAADGAVAADGASPTLSNSVISDSLHFGVNLTGSKAILTGDTFQDNDQPENGSGVGGAIQMDVNSQPTISAASFSNNYVNAVWVDPGTLPAGTTAWNNPDVVYFVPRTITVPKGATLNVGAGQVFKLIQSITVNGTLTAEGTAAAPVTFTSWHDNSIGGSTIQDGNTGPQRGDWNQIQFTNTSTADVLDHVVVRYGGSNAADGEVEADGAAPNLSNSVVSDSLHFGVNLTGSNATLTGDTFQNNDQPENGSGVGGAIQMDVNSQPKISGVSFSNNYVNAVWVDPGTLPSGTTAWNNPDVVYFVPRTVTVPKGATLNVGAGQVVKLIQSITVNGTLTAQGTASDPVTFTSWHDNSIGGSTIQDGNTGPARGDWNQIQFTNTSTNDVLNNVVVNYGGANVAGEVEADGASPAVTNCTFSNSSTFGVHLSGSQAKVTGDTFQNNDQPENGSGVGGAIEIDAASQPTFQNLSMSGNYVNAIWVDPGTLASGTTTWNTPGTVYFVPRTVTVPQGATLSVGAGQVVKLARSIIINGTLTAEGTVAQPTIFTSWHDDSVGGYTVNDGNTGPGDGDWNSLEFTSTSTGSVLNHVEVRYGTDSSDGTLGMVSVTGATLTVSNSVIRNSGHCGIYANTGSTLTLTNDLIVNNSGAGAQGEAGSTFTVINCTLDGNYRDVILDSPTAVLTNDLITNAKSDGVFQTGPTNLQMSYCDVYNPGANSYTGLTDQTNTNSNLAVDPKYFNQPGGQYNLRPGSPAEDAGTKTGAPATDFFGNPRFKDPNITGRGDGSGYDMGAIEVEQTATSNVDLAATAVSGPATGLEDQTVTVNWTVESVGAGTATGSWHDAVYLSSSPVFTPDAILLGVVQHTGDLGTNESYSASGTFTLPGVTPGNYYFLVRANSSNEVFEGTNLANNVAASTATVAMDLPALTLGTPTTGSLAATGSGELYKVTATAGGNLNLSLTGGSGSTNELYVGFGDVPTRQSFLARGVRSGSADQSISIANTQTGTYYVLVYGASVPSTESFSLTASTTGFSLASVAPAQGSNTGQVTISIQGTQFDGNSQPQLVDSAGATIKPKAVYYTDPGLISATFDLTGLPTGPADVQVVNTGGATQTLPHSFNIISGQPGRLETNLVVPSSVRSGRSFTVIVDYSNAGDTDLLAPALQITSTGPAELSFTPDFSYEGSSLNLMATSAIGPAGVLAPGAQGEITLYATTSSAGQCNFQLSVGTYGNGTIDWSAIGASVRPESVTDAQWAALFPQLQTDIGNSWSQYQQEMAADATLLPPQLGNNYSLNDDFKIEFNKALAQLYPSVSGQIFLGDTNHPLGNVPITLIDPTTGNSFETDSLNDGTFVAPGAGQGSYEVMLDGFISTSTAPLVVGATGLTGVQIIAEPGGSISGSVALSPDGSPLPGELVTAVNQDGQSYAGTTGDDGKYTIGSLPAGTYQVSAGGDSYALGSISGITVQMGQVSPDVDLALYPGSTIEGTVSGPGGTVAGALVTAIGADGTSMAATTSAGGTYTIGGLPAQTYTIDVQASGLVEQQLTGVALATGATDTGANVTLTSAGAVSGTIAAKGAPASGATVELTGTAGSFNAVSDSNGSVSFSGLAPGNYTVTAPAAGGFMTASTQVTVTAGATASFTLALAPLGNVTGTVNNSVNGKPVPNVTVYAADAAGFVSSTTTDATGKYELDGFDAGSYQVVLGDEMTPGLAQSDVTFDATHQSATANFSIALAGSISGTVFQSDGVTPVAGALVALVQNGQVLLSMNADSNGEYVFDLVMSGTYQVEADSSGLDFPVLAGLVVGGGNSLTAQNLSAGTDTIHGVVTDSASGKPLAGAAVTLSRADAGVAFTDAGNVVTASDGSFSVTGLVPGSYSVVASATGYATTFKTVALTHGTLASASLALGPGSTVQGTIRDSGTGAPVAGAILTIASANGAGSTSQTDTNGNYLLSSLAPGIYTLAVQSNGYETLVVGQISVGQGNQLLDENLDPSSVSVSGVVQHGSQPLSQVEVAAKDQNGFVVGLATTAADGTFTFTSLPPGTITITASASGYQSSSPTTITVAQGGKVTNISLAMAPVGLSDITISPVLQSISTDIDSNKSGVVLELRNKPIPVGYTLTSAEQALLTGHVPAQCGALQLNARDIAQAQADDRYKQLTADYSNYVTVVNGFLASALTLSKTETSVKNNIKLMSLLVKVLVPLDPTVQEYYAQFSGYLPSQSDVAGITAITATAAGDLVGMDFSNGSATDTNLTSAYRLLDLLLNPGKKVTSPLLNLESNAAFVDALFAAATGQSTAPFDQYLGFGQTVQLTAAKAYLAGLKESNAEEAEEIATIAAKVQPFADSIFKQVETIKNLISQEKAQIAAIGNYADEVTNYNQKVDAFQTALAVLECCVSAHTPAPKNSAIVGTVSTAQVADAAEEPVGGVCVLCGCNSVTPPGDDPVNSGTTNAGGAYDPNNLVGPAGYGSQGYVQPGTFSYEVDFENDPTKATAAAQVVTATFTLDSNLDPSTFQFTGFGFGSHTFTVPPGLTHYQTTIDLRPDGVDLLVPVTMDLDGNAVTVKFQSLDPATMLPPDGLNDGFLPLDDANHDGEGYFTFTVAPKAALPTGTTISEQASIVFDTNAAISTPTATNTLDVGTPTSSVAPLPANSPPSFTLSWSGNDDAGGSGIAFYDVYVSDNGGAFTAFQTATTATSATFTGVAGHTYGFYSVATDNVGHRQATPAAAQATTTVSAAAVLPVSSVSPLPATETSADFTVSWSGTDAGGPGIASYDVYVSDNGGPFTAFQTATAATSASFTGANGHTYGFYSVATDTAGNVQPAPTAAQATTSVVVAAPFSVLDQTYVIGSGTVSESATNGLLAGDTGPSQLMVTAGTQTGTQGGTFTINADGSFTYTPGANFPGYDSTQFTVTDASSDAATHSVTVLSQPAGVVWKFYESVLNRTPDPAGLQYWTNYINNGGNTGDMAFGFFESDELLDKVLGNYYEQYLQRPLDADGLAFWKGVWHATGGPEQIKAGFADSPEFFNSSGATPDSWIDALYQRILNRTPDPAGKSFWLNYYQQQTAAGVDAGTVRYQIAIGFFTATEAFGQDVTGWFQEYLFRAPTDTEKAQYVGQMEGGASDRTIEQAITNLPEYAGNPPAPADGTAAALPDYYQMPGSTASSQAAVAAKDALFARL